MVDSRLSMKNSVEADLKKKIQHAQQVLEGLRDAVGRVEASSVKAKGEVKQAAEATEKMIGNRKLELTNQIDIICHQKINALNDQIQAMCLTLGNLQSTLANLDSFDHTQLMNLHIPNVAAPSGTISTAVDVRLNNAAIEQGLKRWGTIAFPEPLYGGSHNRWCSEPMSSTHTTDVCDIDNWLAGVKLQASPDGDDFEIVSIEDSNGLLDRTGRDVSNGGSKPLTIDEPSNDLSKWLKPKVREEKENADPNNKVDKQSNPPYIHNPLKNRFVDFPCLRTDPKSWLPTKRARMSCLAEPLSGNGMFPPEYALPAPYWLKKYC